MHTTLRHYFSAIVAIAAFVIGVGCARAAEIVTSLFTTPVVTVRQAAQENVGVTSTTNFKSFEPNNADPGVKGRVLSCHDPNILPVWHELKNDDEFKDRIEHSTGVMNCSDMLEVATTDLNQDINRTEFLVRGKGQALCSPVGHCGFWVFEQKNGELTKLLSATDHYSRPLDQVQKLTTRGYTNLILQEHIDISETVYTTYVFDGRQYVEASCVSEVPKIDSEGAGAWELVACR